MDIILLERVAKLGQMGEVVSVKEGYARNYLLPQRKALRANEVNMKAFEDQKAQLEARNLETKKEAEALAAKLDGATFVVIRAASDGGSLYGSVSPRDIEREAKAEGYDIDRKQVVIGDPIKDLGLRDMTIHLHPEVEATVTLNVARSPEEAEVQASGKSIQQIAAEEEAAAEFEIQELFDDIGASQLDELEEGPSGLVETPEEGEDSDNR
ncbi:MAG: 50S ribosomal protein L9 [Salibaculum sp.]|uniref:50S ribosomal protein L9 n=1 Tax=Salibaculum sp. TaxID=2855480 RepID=UPI00287032C0|nr:50S ribosomal protein L9 [Salibaculum sp.]MDR9428150.1 50S ribosomal protein L9 [Salibaculum sp.]MDR9481844.1 50S ribosomal protein L9 [Salibaculum sp.]